jgi:hypothetical protein
MSVTQYRTLKTTGKVKYRNTPCLADGMRFDSKLERDRYLELKWLKSTHAVFWFIRQPRFDLPGGLIYRADFLVVWNSIQQPVSGRVTVEDVKGFMTPVSAMKIKQVEEIYQIKIELIRKVAVRSKASVVD